MGDRTRKLVAMMVRDEKCANYIKNNWLCLYNDILNTHFSKWDTLDELSGYALWDYFDYMGVI